ncbi:hypothetical protein AMTR_s00058p00203000 [Amborella trichopoda]|uniref:Uncharacterized protein n=1 Tax=Amborella trichopoda TaxID=13333 RepID=W1P9X8_AMBTC|nr:hypothetical protein AMTR_s00058p00203000 [Amborella trichopoda]
MDFACLRNIFSGSFISIGTFSLTKAGKGTSDEEFCALGVSIRPQALCWKMQAIFLSLSQLEIGSLSMWVWHAAPIFSLFVRAKVRQGTRSSIGEEEGLKLVWEEVKRARHSSYTPGQRRIGGRHRRLVVQDDDNTDKEQNTCQGGEKHGQFQSLSDYGL